MRRNARPVDVGRYNTSQTYERSKAVGPCLFNTRTIKYNHAPVLIRREQMDVFADYMRRQFVGRMMKHLRANFPDRTRTLDDQGLRTLAELGIVAAESYGIAFEDDIQRYLEYMMVLSQDFDKNPNTSWAGDILRLPDTDGAQKISRIDNVYLFSRK